MEPLILLVEDNPDILKYLKMTLEFNECRVITAQNGVEGLKILKELEKIPDIIVSDIMMPEMNGYDFFSLVSDDPVFSHIPFIFLSAAAVWWGKPRRFIQPYMSLLYIYNSHPVNPTKINYFEL